MWLLLALPVLSQVSKQPEQSSFGGEDVPGIPFIKKPVSIPPAVLEILKNDDTVKVCLDDNKPTSETPFSSWFVASTVHLDGQQERDLVVLPNPDWQPGYGCFYSASGIQWFWIFRETDADYKLLLTTPGNGIQILRNKHAGHRDIRSGTIGSAGRFITTVLYRFDGSRYRKFHEQTKENK